MNELIDEREDQHASRRRCPGAASGSTTWRSVAQQPAPMVRAASLQPRGRSGRSRRAASAPCRAAAPAPSRARCRSRCRRAGSGADEARVGASMRAIRPAAAENHEPAEGAHHDAGHQRQHQHEDQQQPQRRRGRRIDDRPAERRSAPWSSVMISERRIVRRPTQRVVVVDEEARRRLPASQLPARRREEGEAEHRPIGSSEGRRQHQRRPARSSRQRLGAFTRAAMRASRRSHHLRDQPVPLLDPALPLLADLDRIEGRPAS